MGINFENVHHLDVFILEKVKKVEDNIHRILEGQLGGMMIGSNSFLHPILV